MPGGAPASPSAPDGLSCTKEVLPIATFTAGSYADPGFGKRYVPRLPFVNPSNESLGVFDSLEEMEYYTDPDQIFSYRLDPIIKNYSLGYRRRFNKKSIFFRLIKQNADNVNSNLIYLKDIFYKKLFLMNFGGHIRVKN